MLLGASLEWLASTCSTLSNRPNRSPRSTGALTHPLFCMQGPKPDPALQQYLSECKPLIEPHSQADDVVRNALCFLASEGVLLSQIKTLSEADLKKLGLDAGLVRAVLLEVRILYCENQRAKLAFLKMINLRQ